MPIPITQSMKDEYLLSKSVMDPERTPYQSLIDFVFGRTYPEQATSAFTGLTGLKEKPGRGKKPLIPDSDREAFRAAVIELQMKRPGGCINGNDVLHLMQEKYGITCSVRSAYNHLKRAALVWITARSRHPKADQERQEVFKKNFEAKS